MRQNGEHHEEPKALRTVIWERFVSKAVDWFVVMSLGALVLFLFDPVKERALAVWNTPASLRDLVLKVESVLDDVRDVRDDIDALRQPASVFKISRTNTRPVEGFCVERAECAVYLKVRRTVEGLPCKIVPGTVEFGFVNPRTDVYSPARRVDVPTGANVGLQWTTFEITLRTPRDLSPVADFMFTAAYIDCVVAGDSADDAVAYASPVVPFEIRKEN